MQTKFGNVIGRIGAIFGTFGSAAAAAAALNAGQTPRVRDLKRLGIDADAFRSIGR